MTNKIGAIGNRTISVQKTKTINGGILNMRLLNKLNFITVFLFISILHLEAKETKPLKIPLTVCSIDDITLLNSVAPFPLQWLSMHSENERNQQLLNKYLISILDWDTILLKEFKKVPGHNDMGYYGVNGNLENTVRPICYAVLVNAFLSKIGQLPSGIEISNDRRIKMKDNAIKTLRYLTYSHITGNGECMGGGKWGNHWQSSMWTRSAALAGWILWDDLDQRMKLSIARMLEYESNRFINSEPKSQVFDDTGAEENAWNSSSIALACNMLPLHPNREKWDAAAKKYMYNSLSVKRDLTDATIGDNGKMIKEWVATTNVHPDYTLENHKLMHVGYLKNTLCMLMENILPYKLMGNTIPDAVFHNTPEVFGVLKKSMMKDASVVCWGSNDWRIIHSQAVDVLSYAAFSLLRDDKASGYLEDVAVDYVLSLQRTNNGYFNFRRDLEWSGLAATRLINTCLLHSIIGNESKSLSGEEYDKLYNNITYFPSSKTIIHRTSTKFSSFSWGSSILGVSLNKNGNWQNWPRESSYIGIINGIEAKKKNIMIDYINHNIDNKSFNVIGRFRRNSQGTALIQDVSFTSLQGDTNVYIERLTKMTGSVKSRETGIIGHAFELGDPDRIIYSNGNSLPISAHGIGEIALSSNWLNIGGKIGYVICRNGQKNVITYHSVTDKGRNCDYINLIGEDRSDWKSDWACVVTFLNQNQIQTAECAKAVVFKVNGSSATCEINGEKISVNFTDK